ncbi:MAG: hypothetical protein M0R46_04560 [Candidatus Muirbacterium halophilum]|nr:hypothetical protein [Candidatus Muirbacterium halophilum]MCK9475167.1 hypothetical protein [Candidatus Muirbacterium halophilum]
MKIKVLLIIIFMFLSVGYLFYSMDFNIEEKKVIIDEKSTSEVKIDKKNLDINENIKKIENKTDIKNKKEENKKIIDVVKNVKDIILKPKTEEIVKKENENKEILIFVRNYFKREKNIKIEEIVETENKVTLEELLSDILKRINLNFVMESDYDKMAIINFDKVREGDFINISNTDIKILKIEMNSVLISIGTNEVKLEMKR